MTITQGDDPASRSTEAERSRVHQIYAGYPRRGRKRRSWSSTNPGNLAIRAEVVDVAYELAGTDLAAAGAVLDVGCGTGWWLERLACDTNVSAELHGVELLPERVQSAQLRVPGASIRIADARALPFDDQQFDIVTMFTVLSSLASGADAAAAITEAGRVLRPAGVLLVCEPEWRNPANRNTIPISDALLAQTFPGSLEAIKTTTLVPALARGLGAATARLYPRLVKIPYSGRTDSSALAWIHRIAARVHADRSDSVGW